MYKSQVLKGHQVGRTIDFPTVNMDPKAIPRQTKQGVHSSWVYINEQKFAGALYYGPRLVFNEQQTVLEIFILDFNGDLYGQEVEFTIEQFIRPPKNFSDLNKLKKHLKKDILDIRSSLSYIA